MSRKKCFILSAAVACLLAGVALSVDKFESGSFLVFQSAVNDSITGLAVVPNGEGDKSNPANHGADFIVVSVDPGYSPDFRRWEEWANEIPWAYFGLFAYKDRFVIRQRTLNGARARPLHIEMGNGGNIFAKAGDPRLYYTHGGRNYLIQLIPCGGE